MFAPEISFQTSQKLKPSKPIGVSRVGFGDCRKHKSLTKCSGFGHHLQSVLQPIGDTHVSNKKR
jgi:hypothetical protein